MAPTFLFFQYWENFDGWRVNTKRDQGLTGRHKQACIYKEWFHRTEGCKFPVTKQEAKTVNATQLSNRPAQGIAETSYLSKSKPLTPKESILMGLISSSTVGRSKKKKS